MSPSPGLSAVCPTFPPAFLPVAREDAAGAYGGEKATQLTLDAIQLLGGNGYINDYPTGRPRRDAKLYEIGAGTRNSGSKVHVVRLRCRTRGAALSPGP